MPVQPSICFFQCHCSLPLQWLIQAWLPIQQPCGGTHCLFLELPCCYLPVAANTQMFIANRFEFFHCKLCVEPASGQASSNSLIYFSSSCNMFGQDSKFLRQQVQMAQCPPFFSSFSLELFLFASSSPPWTSSWHLVKPGQE